MRTLRAKSILPALLLTATAISAAASATDTVMLLCESFEEAPAATGSGDDADYQWLPSGWQRIATPDITPCYTWYATTAVRGLPAPPDGICYMAIGYQSTVTQDEWLITPHIGEIPANARLTFQLHYDPAVIYDFKLDSSTGEIVFTDDINYTFQTLISTNDGAGWQLLTDLAADFADVSYSQALSYYDDHLATSPERQEIDLSDYAGASARLAFRYLGRNGASMLLDDITITAPSSVGDISTAAPEVIDTYSIDGIKVSSSPRRRGIYIEHLSDGSHRKVMR